MVNSIALTSVVNWICCLFVGFRIVMVIEEEVIPRPELRGKAVVRLWCRYSIAEVGDRIIDRLGSFAVVEVRYVWILLTRCW